MFALCNLNPLYRAENKRAFLCATAVVLASVVDGQDRGAEQPLLEQMHSMPSVMKPNGVGYTASFTMRHIGNPFNDPGQGELAQSIDLAWAPEYTAFTIKNDYDLPPIYRPEGTYGYRPMDYDEEGNLIIHRSIEKVGIRSKTRNQTEEKFEALRVNRNNEVVKRSEWVLTSKFAPEDLGLLSEADTFQIATGLGIGSNLNEVSSSSQISNGRKHIVGYGNLGIRSGEWTMTLDSGASNLIRYAKFTPEDSLQPLQVVENEGVTTAGSLVLAKSGRILRYSGEHPTTVSIELKQLDELEGPQFKSRILERVKQTLDQPKSLPVQEMDLTRGEARITTTNPSGR